MNTKSMFNQAQKVKLSSLELVAHAAWSLVAQSGRPPMTVGQIQKHIALTSGIKPSAYQVRSLMQEWARTDTAYQHNIRQTPVAMVHGYTGGENAVLVLSSLVHVFWDKKELFEAISTLTWPVRSAAIDVSNNLYAYNQDVDAAANTQEVGEQ